jgi:hypothetical protein
MFGRADASSSELIVSTFDICFTMQFDNQAALESLREESGPPEGRKRKVVALLSISPQSRGAIPQAFSSDATHPFGDTEFCF